MQPLRILSYAELKFPSGDARPVAGFALVPDVVERRLGVTLDRGEEPGLGSMRFVRLALPSGRGVFLEWLEWAPVQMLVLMADSGEDRSEVLAEFLQASGLRRDEVTWEPDVGAGAG